MDLRLHTQKRMFDPLRQGLGFRCSFHYSEIGITFLKGKVPFGVGNVSNAENALFQRRSFPTCRSLMKTSLEIWILSST